MLFLRGFASFVVKLLTYLVSLVSVAVRLWQKRTIPDPTPLIFWLRALYSGTYDSD